MNMQICKGERREGGSLQIVNVLICRFSVKMKRNGAITSERNGELVDWIKLKEDHFYDGEKNGTSS